MKTHLTTPHEDYLERISELLAEKGYVRGIDIASRLGVKPSSVTLMLKRLEASGHIVREPYRGFRLTTQGRAVGLKIQKRHKILSEFLHLLRVPERIIEHDIEGLEHDLSNETLAVLTKLTRQLKRKRK